MEFLIRFSQVHESFRQPEIEALAHLFGFELEWLYYSEYVGCYLPFSLSLVSRMSLLYPETALLDLPFLSFSKRLFSYRPRPNCPYFLLNDSLHSQSSASRLLPAPQP